jgi:hypothetical protein
MPALSRPNQKITLAEMRSAGVRGILIYCSDCRCSHWTRLDADRWPDDVRLSDIEPLFTCQACGQRGADVRPNFSWEEEPDARRKKGGRH